MNIEITEQEKEELKKRVLVTAEGRLVNELLDQMRRQVTREVTQAIHRQAKEQLLQLLAGHITEEMVQAHIQKALGELSVATYGDRSALQHELNAAIYRVVEAHACKVTAELKNLLFVSLKQGFYEKKKEG